MTADTVGGVWTYALELVRALPELEFHLATMGKLLSPAQHDEAAPLPNLSVYQSACCLEWMPDPWEDVARAGDWLLDLERECRPDIVHLNGYAHGSLPFQAPVVTVGHSCVLSWWRAVQGQDAPPEWDRYGRAVRGGLCGSDLIVAPTRAMRDALETHYGPLPPSQVIENGRDPSRFAPGEKQPFVFSAGRLWDEAKGLATLAEAAPHLSWPVFVAGDAPPAGAAAVPNLHPLGFLPPPLLARRLSEAAIYALPARYEPFGLSVLEAALSGCALVLGDIPSLREVWGDSALFVPPADADALRGCLLHLIRNDRLRREMAERALCRAARYRPERMAQAYRAVYRQAQENRLCAL